MSKPGKLRVIAGTHRGRSLAVPSQGEVRPTSDRARESLFNILTAGYSRPDGRHLLTGALVLDGFAGSGALGLEALSRGAAQAVFIEMDAGVLPTLRANAQLFLGQARLHQASMLAPPLTTAPADLILMDPPYAFDKISQVMQALEKSGWVGEQTLIVIERDHKDGLDLPGYQLLDQRKAGRNAFWFFKPST